MQSIQVLQCREYWTLKTDFVHKEVAMLKTVCVSQISFLYLEPCVPWNKKLSSVFTIQKWMWESGLGGNRIDVNPRPDAAFPDPADDGGGGRVSTLRLSPKLLDHFSIQKRHLAAPSSTLPNVSHNFIRGSLITPQVRLEARFFTVIAALASPGKIAVSNWKKARGTAWIASGMLLSRLQGLG